MMGLPSVTHPRDEPAVFPPATIAAVGGDVGESATVLGRTHAAVTIRRPLHLLARRLIQGVDPRFMI